MSQKILKTAREEEGRKGAFGVQMLQKSSKTARGGKEGPGQPLTDAACDQVCNPGKVSKFPASGRKKIVGLPTLECGAYLEEHETGWVWGCFIQNGEFGLSAFLPVAFFISTKVFFLSVRRCEFHPDCSSPFSSSK